jgi:tripartite-type tricarboxylate transporter receptor subunit TctC
MRKAFQLCTAKIAMTSLIAAWVTLATAGTSPAAAAQDPIFKDKTIEIYVGTSSGGSFDIYGRLIARHLGAHLPGAPTVVVRNMPGASGFSMTNWLYNVAPKDGTVIGVAPPQVAVNQAMQLEGVRYDARKFNWLFRAVHADETSYTWHSSKTKSIADAKLRETIIGASAISSGGAIYMNLMNATLGTKFKLVLGYAGTTEVHLAMERGEVEGTSKPWAGLKVENADWIRDRKIQILVQYGRERAEELPDVPTLTELARNDLDRKAFQFLTVSPTIGRSFFAPPGVPQERVEILRTSFKGLLGDSDFLSDARAQAAELGPLEGAILQSLVEEAFGHPPEVVLRAKQAGGL